MSTLKLPVWLIATMMLLSMGFVLYPQGSANAAKYYAQLRGATAAGHPDCSFSTLDKCRARVRHRGGGHCYRSHEVCRANLALREVGGPRGGESIVLLQCQRFSVTASPSGRVIACLTPAPPALSDQEAQTPAILDHCSTL